MEMNDAALAFAALGQVTRLELIRVLLQAGSSGLHAGDLSNRLKIPPSTLSFHLRGLEQAGLVSATRQGRSVIYVAELGGLSSLIEFLLSPCCEGDPTRCDLLEGLLGRISMENTRMNSQTFNVLFLCVHNSARSIMAEAILSKIGQGRFVAYSAGSDPLPDGPLPEVLSQLKGSGHNVSGLASKSWREFQGDGAPRMDFVITLCDTIVGQTCPYFGNTTITAAWPLPDPGKFTGSTAERATLLNELYAGLRRRLEIFVNLPVGSLSRMALKARLDDLADPRATAR
jgi:protein-tyrosine-phosphatase/DNA-binding transcriptional ArsR family regulator